MRFPILFFFLALISSYYNPLQCQNLDSSCVVICDIQIQGNKKTKDHIILRELAFCKGDTMAYSQLELLISKSREHLLNTSLFNFVCVDIDSNFVVKVNVIERWYTWAFPVFELSERNFNVWLENKDWNRVNYGFFLAQDNFRGRRESLRFLLRLGYDELVGFSYKIPYINKNQMLGMSFLFTYSRNHEIAINTVENKFVNLKHRHYARTNRYSAVMLSYRPQFHITHAFLLGDERVSVADTIFVLNPEYVASPKQGKNSDKNLNYVSLSYNFKDDHRDLKAYPLSGYYFESEFQYKLGYDKLLSFFSYKIIGKKYYQIGQRWNVSGSANVFLQGGGFSSFYLSKGMGYGNDFVRGYEMYVTKGSYAIAKTNLKFNILKQKVGYWPLINNEKFKKFHYACYLNVFTDLGKDFKGSSNDFLHKKNMYGNGVGLDFVTYYDKVLRLECARNRIGEIGLFIHFIAPI